MAEWSNAAVLKTVGRESVPRVRIPVSPPLIPVSLQLYFLTRNCAAIPARWRMRFQSETEQIVHSERNSGRSLSAAFWRGRFGLDFPDNLQFTGNFRKQGLISVIYPVRTGCFSEVYAGNSLKSGTGSFLASTGNCADGSGRANPVSGKQDWSYQKPNRFSCSAQSSGWVTLTRRLSVSSGGWVPSRIAA